MSIAVSYESVAVSSRIRLARNFADYPFPGRLLTDPHAEEQAREIVQLISAELNAIEKFKLYDIGSMTDEHAEFLVERHLISRDLLRHRRISAALVSEDESISVMLNEEDHIREQYFMKGFDLQKAYERLSGIDDVIGDSIPFAYDEMFGYLTACPTNLGTGLRASVMLFLPAISRRGMLKAAAPILAKQGLTMRGAYGEGSEAEGDLFQISNETTLGMSELGILAQVEDFVSKITEMELRERGRMKAEGGIALKDSIFRSYGILMNCCKIDLKEFMRRTADVKLGIALGYFEGVLPKLREKRMEQIDDLIVAMRPANIRRLNRAVRDGESEDVFRASFAAAELAKLKLLP